MKYINVIVNSLYCYITSLLIAYSKTMFSYSRTWRFRELLTSRTKSFMTSKTFVRFSDWERRDNIIILLVPPETLERSSAPLRFIIMDCCIFQSLISVRWKPLVNCKIFIRRNKTTLFRIRGYFIPAWSRKMG